MSVVKLNASHVEQVKPLFMSKKYMGVDASSPDFYLDGGSFHQVLYDIFCSNYLSDLNNFHAFGYLDGNKVQALISFYESFEEPAWYYTVYRSAGDNDLLRPVLDKVIDYNENHGRFKFYTLVHARHSKLLRRFHWSKYNDERYDYIDEFIVPAKTKCFYANHWELLFKRVLMPEDSVVRCNFLKKEYRKELPIGGNL